MDLTDSGIKWICHRNSVYGPWTVEINENLCDSIETLSLLSRRHEITFKLLSVPFNGAVDFGVEVTQRKWGYHDHCHGLTMNQALSSAIYNVINEINKRKP